jgi:hypothetical protein
LTDAPRYPVTPTSPPFRVRVRVFWRGREFEAARTTQPQSGRPCWATRDRETMEDIYLPPRGDARRDVPLWGENPDWWQPLVPDKWKAPLPPPLTASIRPAEGTMAALSFRDADGHRRYTNVQHLIDVRPGRRRLGINMAMLSGGAEVNKESGAQWWRDPLAITYEPAGQVSNKMAEGRVMRAVAVSGATLERPASAPDDRVLRDLDEAIKQATKEAEDPRSDGMARFEPTNIDGDDWLIAMAWFAALNPPELRHKRSEPWALSREQKILVWRAMTPPLSFRQIGGLIKRHWTAGHQAYDHAITRVHRAANGRPAFGHISRRDPIAALQERNRAFKRRGGV